jgi:ESS family glutamate:Na+ symporter
MQNMNQISLDMYQTLGMAVAVLFFGVFLKKRIKFLETFCIPSPVVGGLIFAIVSCILYATGILEISFDETLKNVCMVIFFTSVGFQANLKVLKSGGLSLVVFLVCVIVLIISQNLVSVGLAKLVGVSPLIGLSTGSIPMVGGHGTAGAFGPVLEDLGISGASTLCTAAATFGLVAGSLMGGPIGRRLILKHDLLKTAVMEDDATLVEDEKKHKRSVSMYAPATYQIAIAMGLGTIVSWALSKTGMTFPIYIGAMIVAAAMRNISEHTNLFTVNMGEINDIGGICLSLFLGIAMITLKLWQLASLALPLLILLAGQVALMFVFTYFVLFNVMGRNYDAAVLAAGTCGFGMGATPNAMANMQALTEKYVPSVKAYLLVPIIGSMFADFLNSLTITFFINLF